MLSGDSDSQPKMHDQKPFVGRAPPGPAGGAHGAPQPQSWIGEALGEACRGGEGKIGREAKMSGE